MGQTLFWGTQVNVRRQNVYDPGTMSWVFMTQAGGGGGGGGAVTVADGADVAEGSTADAAWSGSGSGTVVSILKKIASSGTGGGPATISDGADVTQGAIADAAVTGDNTGTLSAKLRGLNKLFADVWDSVNHWLKVSIQNTTLAVTQSGNWSTRTQDGSGTAITSHSSALDVSIRSQAAALTVDGSGVTQPVSGTVTANQGGSWSVTATGSGTFNNQQSNVQADFDTGAPTQNVTLWGMALPASGGAVIGGTATNPIRTDPTGTTTQPVSGTVTTNPPANATENLTQLAGTAVDTNSGAKSAGTLRVVLATDQPQLTNALKVDGSATVQPVSGTVTANQGTTPWSENVSQFGGTNVVTGTGASGLGIPRVTVSSDSSLAANQSVNVNQFGGSAVATGTGASGAGIPRVTVANDSNVLASQSGSWTVQQGSPPWITQSNKSQNNAPPDSTLDGVMPALANAAAPSLSEGKLVLLSVDLLGQLRIAPVTVNAGTNLNTSALALETGGNLAALVTQGYTDQALQYQNNKLQLIDAQTFVTAQMPSGFYPVEIPSIGA